MLQRCDVAGSLIQPKGNSVSLLMTSLQTCLCNLVVIFGKKYYCGVYQKFEHHEASVIEFHCNQENADIYLDV